MKLKKLLYIALAMTSFAIAEPYATADDAGAKAMSEDDVTRVVEQVTKRLAKQKTDLDAQSDKDPKYDSLACKTTTAKYDRAVCLAGNLDSIQEKSATDKKYTKLYSEAIRTIKSELAKTFANASDAQSLEDARHNYDDLADAIGTHENSELQRVVKQLRPSLERAAQDRIKMQNAEKAFNDRIVPGLDNALNNLQDAQASGDRFAAIRAQSQYDYLMLDAQRLMGPLRRLDPTRNIQMMSQFVGSYDVDYFSHLYQQTLSNVDDSMRFYQQYMTDSGRRIGGGDAIGDVGFSRDGRQSRNPGFQPYNPYGTSAVRPQGSNPLYQDDFSASQYMSGRTGTGTPRSSTTQRY